MPHMFWECDRLYFDHQLLTPKFDLMHTYGNLGKFDYRFFLVSYTFFEFILIFVFIGIQTTLFGHSDEQNPVCHFTYISVPGHCCHL